ncbi:3-carboxyethylcatechol 2,3-dioxygenase [Burkholderia vietnamiensis]|uniref:3-carboxyethylcatechol 2,3-dioxygenase n=1 Tax=Burkholderia vietnamiensis TaxID=60552 RepID=UPI000D78783B|nr:3-carboxyethylcatechol 2,3-dioxygenase [Burkholderia vietnamiensis]
MPIHLECMSPTPLHGYFDPAPAVVAEVERVQRTARERVDAFDPELVIVFAPDHYNGFFYDVMPQFCIGASATAVGDFGSAAGPLPVARDAAPAPADAALAGDIGVAVSYRMQVDHGCAQALGVLTGRIDRFPVVPVFINSVAPPMASCRRARLPGDAIGRGVARMNRRVWLIGSGGISHEPPVPEIAGADDVVAERLIAGRNPSPASRDARQSSTVAAARAFAAGDSRLHPLNPAWDRRFLELPERGDLTAADGLPNEAIARDAGKSAHEIRTWVAAFGALAASGPYTASIDYYRAIPEWIAGFGAMHARERTLSRRENHVG